MGPTHRRRDISAGVREMLSPLLPGQVGQWCTIAKDNRLFMNAVFWILRTGVPRRVARSGQHSTTMPPSLG